MLTRNLSFILAWLAILFLTGSQCTFIASSSSHNDKDDENETGLLVIIGDDPRVGDPVQGVRIISGSQSGVTGPDGEFQYQSGTTVRFFIGDIQLGEAIESKRIITPLDLVPGGNIDTPAVINITRLLISLDAQPGDSRISIASELRHTAVRTNSALAPYLQSLDYHDETAFVNAASQIVATLTATYPFTAVLIDASSVQRVLESR